MKRLAIITTHPIQYYAPIFQLLHRRQKIEIRVFYTWGELSVEKYDPGFDKKIHWDIPLLDGYNYEWVKNTSKDPGTHHFYGIVNPDIISQVNKWQPDAVLIYGWAYQGHLKAIRHFGGKVPVLFRGDSTLLDEKKGAKGLLKTVFLRWLYGHIAYALYVGANNKEYFKKFGLKEGQLKFAPHAIDNERFATDQQDESSLLRRQLGIKDDELIILFAGKLETKKAPGLLLDAFINLNEIGVHLLFIGNGPLEDQLKLKANLYLNVHFMDFQNQSQMPAAYQACNLFCLPSKGPGETWGLAINEAMACKKAILVSDKVGCAVDLVKNYYNGIVFRSGNIDELTLSLNKLIKSKDLLFEYGQNSASTIKDWNFEVIAEVIENSLTV